MRAELIDKLWAKDEPKVFISKDQYVGGLEGWEVEPHLVDGVVAFVTVVKGPEFHFQSFGGYRITMPMIRAFLQGLIDRNGYALTRTPHEDGRQQRFNRKLGFSEVGRDEFDTIFRIERINRSCRL